MSDAARTLMSVEAFLAWDDGTDRRYELVDGLVRAMVSPLDTHGTIVVNLAVGIVQRLRPDCRVLTEAGLMPRNRARSFYQSDLAITCTPHRSGGRRSVEDPVVVIEVLSPSTEKFDRERKAIDYRSIPSVREIMLVSTTARRVEIWRRAGDRWLGVDFIGDAVAILDSFALDLPLDEIYRNLAFASDDTSDQGRAETAG